MDYLFGTSKPKPAPPKVNINAPTLSETSATVIYFFKSLDGQKSEGDLSQNWWMQRLAKWSQEKNVNS